ncbi:MAG: hypothetical protein KAG66_16790, partial [Methylococcales bacterium]|nr:hypothetical protein [Methylococcales bacterium]
FAISGAGNESGTSMVSATFDGSNTGLDSFDITMSFDPALIQIDSLTLQADYPFNFGSTIDNGTGTLHLIGAANFGSIIPGPTNLFEIAFTTTGGFTTGSTQMTFDDPVFAACDGGTVPEGTHVPATVGTSTVVSMNGSEAMASNVSFVAIFVVVLAAMTIPVVAKRRN